MKRIIQKPIRILSKDGMIKGEYLPDGKVKIFSGSFFRNTSVNSIRQNVINKRLFLVNNGYVNENQLIRDIIFDNPSLAISILMGHMENGNQAFVTLDNIELGEYLEIDEVEYYEQRKGLENYIKNLENQPISKRPSTEDDDSYGIISTNDIDESFIKNVDYNPLPKPEKTSHINNSFSRNVEIAKRSIVIANYKCCLDGNHRSFFTKSGNPYMEAHHFIPLSTQDYFEFSLDVEANIISLCPNCHRKLHYGADIIGDLKKLYDDRISKLKISGIHITFDELLKLYDISFNV